MTTIPERVQAEARKLIDEGSCADCINDIYCDCFERYSQALLAAEKRGREEAALVAENCVPHGIHPDDLYRWRQTADILAAAIRSTN